MNTFNIKALVITVSLAFSAGVMAQNITKSEYNAGKDRISTEYKQAKAGCDGLSGNSKDICVVEAKGLDKVALAELETQYKPSAKNLYNLRVAKAEADYAVANERCDDSAGNVKDVCVKEAKAGETAAKADAKAQMKMSDANAVAGKKSVAARSEANEETTAALKDASADKVEAEYAVAREKCDAFADGAKETCLDRAKVRFGKS